MGSPKEYQTPYYREYRKRPYVKEKERAYRKSVYKRNYLRSKESILQLKMEMGGKCSKCEYDKEPRILHFHHLYGKKFTFADVVSYRKIDTLREEAQKCILLCPNCHAILHLRERK